MTFSTYMKWGNNDFLFVRPIQWIVSLLEDEIVAFDLLDVTANRFHVVIVSWQMLRLNSKMPMIMLAKCQKILF